MRFHYSYLDGTPAAAESLGDRMRALGAPDDGLEFPGLAEVKGLDAGRVASVGRDALILACPARPAAEGLVGSGFLRAELSGAYRNSIERDSELPVAGDWVAYRDAGELGIVTARAERSSFLSRKAPGPGAREQALCANAGYLLVAMACGDNYSLKRLDRYLALAREAGMEPVLLLTKADLLDADAAGRLLAEAGARGGGIPAFLLAAMEGRGLAELAAFLQPGSSSVLMGSSGAGKSTLINALLGEERIATAGMSSANGKGRHTTTARELHALPGGALVIDSPGIREVGLWCSEGAVDGSFPEIEALAALCRFGDCAHGAEPGCAVRAALEGGCLPAETWVSYQKLRREAAWISSEADLGAARARASKWKQIAKFQGDRKKRLDLAREAGDLGGRGII